MFKKKILLNHRFFLLRMYLKFNIFFGERYDLNLKMMSLNVVLCKIIYIFEIFPMRLVFTYIWPKSMLNKGHFFIQKKIFSLPFSSSRNPMAQQRKLHQSCFSRQMHRLYYPLWFRNEFEKLKNDRTKKFKIFLYIIWIFNCTNTLVK